MAVQTNLRQRQGRKREHVIKYIRRSPYVRGSESAFHEGLVFVHSEIKSSHDEGLATVGHKHRGGQDCDRPHLLRGCYKGLATSCNIKKCCLGRGHHHRTHCAPVCRNSDLDLPDTVHLGDWKNVCRPWLLPEKSSPTQQTGARILPRPAKERPRQRSLHTKKGGGIMLGTMPVTRRQ